MDAPFASVSRLSFAHPLCARVQKAAGFTLIELMVVMAIVAILAALAAPSFREQIAAQRLRNESSALIESVWTARSEALKRNSDVGFTYTTPAAGWEIKAGATVLHTQDGVVGVTARINASNDPSAQVNFNAFGRLTTGAASVQLNAGVTNVYRCVSISATGRVQAIDGACT